MKTEMEFQRNLQGGIDLLVSDGENKVLHETGNSANSMRYWIRMHQMAKEAIKNMPRPQTHMVVLMGRKGKGTTRSVRRKVVGTVKVFRSALA